MSRGGSIPGGGDGTQESGSVYKARTHRAFINSVCTEVWRPWEDPAWEAKERRRKAHEAMQQQEHNAPE